MLVFNTSTQRHNVRVFGKHFEFAPGAVKDMSEDIASWIGLNKRYLGLVTLPPICSEDPNSPEAAAAKESAKSAGIQSRIAYLATVIRNEEVSLRQDMDKNNDKSSTGAHLNKGLLEVYREFAGYQDVKDNESKKMEEEAAKLKHSFRGKI